MSKLSEGFTRGPHVTSITPFPNIALFTSSVSPPHPPLSHLPPTPSLLPLGAPPPPNVSYSSSFSSSFFRQYRERRSKKSLYPLSVPFPPSQSLFFSHSHSLNLTGRWCDSEPPQETKTTFLNYNKCLGSRDSFLRSFLFSFWPSLSHSHACERKREKKHNLAALESLQCGIQKPIKVHQSESIQKMCPFTF